LARSGLLQCLERFTPDIAVYIAGSDPYEKDVLPGTRFINLTLEELEERDRFVIDTLYERKIPTAMVFAGGYGPDVWEVHYRAVRHLLIKGHANTQEPVPNGINSH
jgi:acetoin utilization deacetylase AcuC-like enzyme